MLNSFTSQKYPFQIISNTSRWGNRPRSGLAEEEGVGEKLDKSDSKVEVRIREEYI